VLRGATCRVVPALTIWAKKFEVGAPGLRTFKQKLLSTGCGVGVGVEIGVGVNAGDEEDDPAGVDTGVEIGVLGSAMGVELDDNKEELAGPGLDEL
jgi:hypothetical protein